MACRLELRHHHTHRVSLHAVNPRQQHERPVSGLPARSSTAVAAASKAHNPDLDGIQLDDAYYAEIGMTREESMRQQREILYSVDPEAVPLDDLASVDSSTLPEEWRQAIENLEVYGPQALVMAGFRAEEYAVARGLLDSLGAQDVKVLPASQEMLQSPLAVALAEPEIDWNAPRPPDWIMGGAWGSQRTILFSGLSVKVQATLLELLESQGLPQHICVTMALQEDQHRRLGEVMAAAVQAQRTVKPPAAAPWEVPRRASSSSSSNNDVTVKNTSSNTNSSGSSGSAPGGRKSLLSGLPGKKGPLFSRKPAAGRGAAGAPGVEGLEPLQDLISPDLARARLQAAGRGAGLTDLIDLHLSSDEGEEEQRQQQQQQQQLPGGSSSTFDQQAAAESQALLDWVQDEATGQVVELPWVEDEPQAAAAAAAVQQHLAQPAGNAAAAATEELPYSLDELLPSVAPPPAAASSSNGSSSTSSSFWEQQQQQQQRQGFAGSRASAASSVKSFAHPQGAAAAAAAAAGADDDIDLSGPSVFATIQAALKSGVDPERLKQLIDEAAAAGAAAADPIDLLLKDEEAKAEAAATAAKQNSSSSSTESGTSQAAHAAAPFGPVAPPPSSSSNSSNSSSSQPANDPLLKLRPEIERAFENNQIKFVDMTKLPSKYRKQYTHVAMQERQRAQQQQLQQQQDQELEQQLAARSEGEMQQLLDDGSSSGSSGGQQQQQQRWWQRQQRSQKQQALVEGLSAGMMSTLPKGKIVELEVGGAQGVPQGMADRQAAADANDMLSFEEDDEYAEFEEGEEEAQQALYLDESKLQQLVDSAHEEGLDITQTLAQALAYGVEVSPEVAAAVGVQLPSPEMITAAQKEIVSSIRELQQQHEDEAEEGDDCDGEEVEVQATTISSRGAAAGEQGAGTAAGHERSRRWGSGLNAAVGRAKARLAEKKKRQQQQEQS